MYLYEMYNLCEFTDEVVSVHSDLDTILGCGWYDDTSLETEGAIIQPYGPFCIQTHNQIFRWNKAIIVEPIVDEPALARILQVLKCRAPYGRAVETRKRRMRNCNSEDQRQDSDSPVSGRGRGHKAPTVAQEPITRNLDPSDHSVPYHNQ